MRYAINVPNFGDYADPATFLRLARRAEAAGWDGLFVWDHVLVDPDWGVPIADPWALLAAAGAVTRRIRLGPMVTPLPRRRPWIVARQASTIDHLTGGRLTLGVGMGAPPDAEFAAFGEDSDPAVRARKLDEGLAILDGLWSGAPFAHAGTEFHLQRMRFEPVPLQRPRIPIWVGGYWPHREALVRAARWDGVVPASRVTDATGQTMPVKELAAVLDVIRRARGSLDNYAVMVMGRTPPELDAASSIVEPLRAVGATWWSELLSGWRGSLTEMEERVAAGPPRVAATSAS